MLSIQPMVSELAYESFPLNACKWMKHRERKVCFVGYMGCHLYFLCYHEGETLQLPLTFWILKICVHRQNSPISVHDIL